MKTLSFDGQAYIAPSWQEMGGMCFKLSKEILAKKLRFDRIVALAKGGLTWSRTLADNLAIENVSVTHIRFYTGIGQTNKQPIIIQSLPISVEKETLLIFDDVADSGETLTTARDYLAMCGAQKVYTATLFAKFWTKFQPDFSAASTDAWILFPHEVRESIAHLSRKWNISKSEKEKRFTSLGFPKEQVEYFLNQELRSKNQA